MTKITPQSIAESIGRGITSRLDILRAIPRNAPGVPDLATISATVKLMADTLADLDAIAVTPFDAAESSIFKLSLARVPRCTDSQALARAIRQFTDTTAIVLARVRPTESEIPF